MIVHVQTNVQCVFGKLDDEGNVIEQIPVTLSINALKAELFAEAHKQLVAQKSKIEEKVNGVAQ